MRSKKTSRYKAQFEDSSLLSSPSNPNLYDQLNMLLCERGQELILPYLDKHEVRTMGLGKSIFNSCKALSIL